MKTEIKTELIQLIKKLSYREGHFVLASGKESKYYIDSKNVTLHPKGAKCIGKLVWNLCNVKKYAGVGGPTLGADPLATAVSLAAYDLGIECPAFIIRKEPKKHGTSQWIEGRENLTPGSNLLILEDVVTTGGSSIKAIEKIRAEGFVVDTLVCVLDRDEGGREALKKNNVELIALTNIKDILG